MSDTKGKINLLEVVPVQCGHITTEWEGECAVLAFPRFKYEWMRRFLLPKGMSPDIHVRLEEHGSAVWRLIDGQRTVQEIISLLAEPFKDEENYPSRIATYVMQLQKDGFVQLKLKN
nr:PqqD family protein [uncultured Bacteroides sp.]